MNDLVQTISASQEIAPRENWYIRSGKRAMDLTMVAALAPVALPIIGALYVLARRDGGAPFYGHVRIGKDGTPFKCWKVRSMVVDSRERLRAHLEANPEAAEEWARDHKLTHDPRITRFGAFIRKTSLDELPQLWNVIKGEMSMVGPRPVVREELKKYGAKLPWYIAQKPGITGLWQVSGRNEVSYDERVDLDVAYAQRCSVWLDLKIVAKTALEVFARSGK